MLISIITINLNNAQGLQRTINSVIQQTYTYYEWIVIDGASTDDSIKIITKYEHYFSYWESSPDNGIYCAMNKGIRHASGDYILFLNSGDTLARRNVFEIILPYLNKTDIIAGYVTEDKSSITISAPQCISPKNLLVQNIPHQAEFIKRSLFHTIGLYSEEYKILSDFEFNLKCSLRGCSYTAVNELISYVEPGGISNTLLPTMEHESDEIVNQLLPTNILKDYYEFIAIERKIGPAVIWAMNCKWLNKTIRILHLFFDKNK